MILFLNGAFGIGKTTLARVLKSKIGDSAIYDPELAGLALQRVGRLVGLRIEDFQNLPVWRTLTGLGIRLMRMRRRTVIVPMAISDEGILAELLAAARAIDPDVRHYCLVAPVEFVHARLASRGADRVRNAWEYRRAAECCEAHGSETFALRIHCVDYTPEQLASLIFRDTSRIIRRSS